MNIPQPSLKHSIALLVSLSAIFTFIYTSTFHPAHYITYQTPNNSTTVTSPKKPFAVVSFFSPEETINIAHYSEHISSRKCYAQLHNFDFITTPKTFVHPDPEIFYTDLSATRIRPNDISTIKWNKVFLIKEALLHYEWILFTDNDILVKNFSWSIVSFVQTLKNTTQDIHIVVPMEEYRRRSKLTFSNYAMLLRGSPLIYRFLDDWIAVGRNCPQVFYNLIDQPPMWIALIHMVQEYHNITAVDDCMMYCTNRTARAGNAFQKCVELGLHSARHKRGHVRGHTKPPVAFMRFSGGTEMLPMPVQANWGGDFQANQYRAWALHAHAVVSRNRLYNEYFIATVQGEDYISSMRKCFPGFYFVDADKYRRGMGIYNGDFRHLKTASNDVIRSFGPFKSLEDRNRHFRGLSGNSQGSLMFCAYFGFRVRKVDFSSLAGFGKIRIKSCAVPVVRQESWTYQLLRENRAAMAWRAVWVDHPIDALLNEFYTSTRDLSLLSFARGRSLTFRSELVKIRSGLREGVVLGVGRYLNVSLRLMYRSLGMEAVDFVIPEISRYDAYNISGSELKYVLNATRDSVEMYEMVENEFRRRYYLFMGEELQV